MLQLASVPLGQCTAACPATWAAELSAAQHASQPLQVRGPGTDCRCGCRRRRAVLHIIDTDPTSLSANGWLEDTSKVEKYVMSEEDYAKRDNTYRWGWVG